MDNQEVGDNLFSDFYSGSSNIQFSFRVVYEKNGYP